MNPTVQQAADPLTTEPPTPARQAARPWWRQTPVKLAALLALGLYITLHVFVIGTPDDPAPLERAAAAVQTELDPYPRSPDAEANARLCGLYTVGPNGTPVPNPTYDQAACVALGQAATGQWLATIPRAEGHGTCPLPTRHACREALGLPQTMETADWWAPWQTPNGAKRLAFCIGLCAAAALIVTATTGLSAARTLTWAAIVGWTACLPGLLQDPTADPTWNPLWTRLAAAAVAAGMLARIAHGVRSGQVALPRVRLAAVRARIARRSAR